MFKLAVQHVGWCLRFAVQGLLFKVGVCVLNNLSPGQSANKKMSTNHNTG